MKPAFPACHGQSSASRASNALPTQQQGSAATAADCAGTREDWHHRRRPMGAAGTLVGRNRIQPVSWNLARILLRLHGSLRVVCG